MAYQSLLTVPLINHIRPLSSSMGCCDVRSAQLETSQRPQFYL